MTDVPPGKLAVIRGGIGLRLELEHAAVAIQLPHTSVVRTQDPDVLEQLGRRLLAAADTLRRYREHGEVPMIGGAYDPHRQGVWWQD